MMSNDFDEISKDIVLNNLEQFTQILNKITWDGNLISKSQTKTLRNKGLISRINGFNFVSSNGVFIAIELGLLKN